MIRALIAMAAALMLTPLPATASPPATGSFIDLPAVKSTNVAPVHVTIWLPPGYAKARTRFPVIYMHDGQNAFFPKQSGYGKVWAADKAMLKLIAAGETKGAIIVAMWSPRDGRARQYFPQKIYADLPPDARAEADLFLQGPVYSDAQLRFLVNELKPMIDKRFRTRPGRDDTYVVGSSMGGLISFYAISQYPKIFGGAACVSTHWPLASPERIDAKRTGAILAVWDRYIRSNLGPPDGRRIWFDHGDQTLDQYYPAYQSEIDRKLIAIGWQPKRDFETRSYPGAAHEENAWAARLDEIFRWLLVPQPAS